MRGILALFLVVLGMVMVIASAIGGFLAGVMLMSWSNRQDEKRKEEAKVGPAKVTYRGETTQPIPSWAADALPDEPIVGESDRKAPPA